LQEKLKKEKERLEKEVKERGKKEKEEKERKEKEKKRPKTYLEIEAAKVVNKPCLIHCVFSPPHATGAYNVLDDTFGQT
jgi:hypothetical protein